MLSMPAGALPALAHSRHVAVLPVFRCLSAVILLSCAATVPPERSYAQSAPAKPTGFTVADGNTQEIGLRWTGPGRPRRLPNGNIAIPAADYRYVLFGEWTDMAGKRPQIQDAISFTGLVTNNRESTISRIRAVNDNWIQPRIFSEETGTNPTVKRPIQADRVARDPPAHGKATLSWNEADYINIWGWDYRQKESGGSYGSWKPIPGSDASTITHTVIDGLENGTEHTFRFEDRIIPLAVRGPYFR